MTPRPKRPPKTNPALMTLGMMATPWASCSSAGGMVRTFKAAKDRNTSVANSTVAASCSAPRARSPGRHRSRLPPSTIQSLFMISLLSSNSHDMNSSARAAWRCHSAQLETRAGRYRFIRIVSSRRIGVRKHVAGALPWVLICPAPSGQKSGQQVTPGSKFPRFSVFPSRGDE